MNNACFIVRDKNGQQLGYFYYEVEPGRRTAASLLTKDEARQLATNFAKPDSLQQTILIAVEARYPTVRSQFCFCDFLAPVYRRFIAGYDTLAPKEVKALPDELWSVSPLCFAISNNLNNNGRREGDCKEHYPQTHSKSNYPLSIHFVGSLWPLLQFS